MMRTLILLFLSILIASININASAEQGTAYYAAIPAMHESVNDKHGVLTIQQKLELTRKLEALNEQNGAEVVVLIVSSTSGESLRNYTFRAMNVWEQDHDGRPITVLMTINAEDASYFIGTSPAIQHVLPDNVVQGICVEKVDPYWHRSKWFEGIDAGLSDIVGIVEKESFVNSSIAIPLNMKTRDWIILGLVFTGFFYTLIYFIRWRRSSELNSSQFQHAIVYLSIIISIYIVATYKTELDKLQEVQSILAKEGTGIREVKAGPGMFNIHNYIVPGAYTILYFYSNSCPGCRLLDANLKHFTDVRPDVAVRKFDLGYKWSADDAYNLYKLEIGKTPFIHIYGPTGDLIAEDSRSEGEGQDLLYKWMNLELHKLQGTSDKS
ncbi:MAG: TPM domain-containing protein [Gammaproteobacteria bacterium]|nr:TPM domain-containing protein [Gammaproteobacteria bacterium]